MDCVACFNEDVNIYHRVTKPGITILLIIYKVGLSNLALDTTIYFLFPTVSKYINISKYFKQMGLSTI